MSRRDESEPRIVTCGTCVFRFLGDPTGYRVTYYDLPPMPDGRGSHWAPAEVGTTGKKCWVDIARSYLIEYEEPV